MAKHGSQPVLLVVVVLALLLGLFVAKDMGAFSGQQQYGLATTTATATSSLPYWQTAYLTQTQAVTHTATQTVVASSTAPGPAGATCNFALGSTDINMGENLVGAVYTNRVGVEVIVYAGAMGQTPTEVLRGITDASGQYAAASGAMNLPGIYQISVLLNFGGVTVSCNPGAAVVTVHGIYIAVEPDSIPTATLSTVTFVVYSDRPGQTFTIESKSDINPAWGLWGATGATDAAGRVLTSVNLITGADWYVFRAVASDGALSANEEWLDVV